MRRKATAQLLGEHQQDDHRWAEHRLDRYTVGRNKATLETATCTKEETVMPTT